jgi:hypothetical protein
LKIHVRSLPEIIENSGARTTMESIPFASAGIDGFQTPLCITRLATKYSFCMSQPQRLFEINEVWRRRENDMEKIAIGYSPDGRRLTAPIVMIIRNIAISKSICKRLFPDWPNQYELIADNGTKEIRSTDASLNDLERGVTSFGS